MQSWMCGIARNCVLEHHRDTTKQDRAVKSLGHIQAGQSDPTVPPQQDTVEDVRMRVNLSLAQMPELYSRVLVMKYVHRKSTREIAGCLGRSEKAVESLLGRARDAFRRHFREVRWGEETQ